MKLPSYHRPNLAKEVLGAPELHLLPEDDGIRVLVYGWRLASQGSSKLFLESTNGALAYQTALGVLHASSLEELTAFVNDFPQQFDSTEFERVVGAACNTWPYLADDADWLDYELVPLARVYGEPQAAAVASG